MVSLETSSVCPLIDAASGWHDQLEAIKNTAINVACNLMPQRTKTLVGLLQLSQGIC